jgi:isoamylase
MYVSPSNILGMTMSCSAFSLLTSSCIVRQRRLTPQSTHAERWIHRYINRVTQGAVCVELGARRRPLVSFGVTWSEEEHAYNFALYAKHAESVTLLLYREDDLATPVFTYQFDSWKNKSGRIWHCRLPTVALKGAQYYAYTIAGPRPNGRFEWHHFDPQKILLDPYAKAIFFPPTFDRRAAMQPGSNAGKAPLGLIAADHTGFDWDNDRRLRHESDTIIYELHVKGFTKHRSSGVPSEHQGTY